MAMEASQAGILQWSVSITIPALSGLAGVIIGGILAGRREKAERRHQFILRQVQDFYAPLLAIRNELKVLGEISGLVSGAQNEAWQDLCARYEGNTRALGDLMRDRSDEFVKDIQYDNKIFDEKILPEYHRMIELFRKNMWLAEPSTLEHFPALVKFVDIWERWMTKTITGEAVRRLKHTEKWIFPLYEDIEKTHADLRAQLAGRGMMRSFFSRMRPSAATISGSRPLGADGKAGAGAENQLSE